MIFSNNFKRTDRLENGLNCDRTAGQKLGFLIKGYNIAFGAIPEDRLSIARTHGPKVEITSLYNLGHSAQENLRI